MHPFIHPSLSLHVGPGQPSSPTAIGATGDDQMSVWSDVESTSDDDKVRKTLICPLYTLTHLLYTLTPPLHILLYTLWYFLWYIPWYILYYFRHIFSYFFNAPSVHTPRTYPLMHLNSLLTHTLLTSSSTPTFLTPLGWWCCERASAGTRAG